MLGYASPSVVASRRFSPTSVALIVASHAGLLALVIGAKMEAIPRTVFDPTVVVPIPMPKPQPPPPTSENPKPTPSLQPSTKPTVTRPLIKDLPISGTALGGDVTIPTGPFPGSEVIVEPPPLPHKVLHRAATLATPEGRLRPPYPLSKQRLGEEASLSLRLTVAADGRVTSVDAARPADPVFLAAARRHILAHWRYRPATDDGTAVATVLTIQLSFKLDEAG